MPQSIKNLNGHYTFVYLSLLAILAITIAGLVYSIQSKEQIEDLQHVSKEDYERDQDGLTPKDTLEKAFKDLINYFSVLSSRTEIKGTAHVFNLKCKKDMNGTIRGSIHISNDCDQKPKSLIIKMTRDYNSNNIYQDNHYVYTINGTCTHTNDLGSQSIGKWYFKDGQLIVLRKGYNWTNGDYIHSKLIHTKRGNRIDISYYRLLKDGSERPYESDSITISNVL